MEDDFGHEDCAACEEARRPNGIPAVLSMHYEFAEAALIHWWDYGNIFDKGRYEGITYGLALTLHRNVDELRKEIEDHVKTIYQPRELDT